MRWFCETCGIVRDLHEGTDIAWCHHNAMGLPSARMVPIPMSHPLATGELPWGTADP